MITPIAVTKKGHRVWIQGIADKAPVFIGAPFSVLFTPEAIIISVDPEGKRMVTGAKGGIIDIESKKVTVWAQGAKQASVEFIGPTILITRA